MRVTSHMTNFVRGRGTDEFDPDGHLLGTETYRKKQFDLCKECVKRFVQDPLGRQAVQRFELSKP